MGSNTIELSQAGIKINGVKIEAKATGMANYEAGGMMTVKASGMMTVESSAITNIKGSMVKIN